MQKSEKENALKENAETVKAELKKAIADEMARENMGEYFYYIGKSGNTLNLRASAIEKIAFLYDIEKKNIPNAINENKSYTLYSAIERAIKANSDQFYRTKDKTYKD